MFYCVSTHLIFNSGEFNNIASPIISFLGFIGVIFSILLTLNQLKQQQSTSYFNYYKDLIDKIANENPQNNSDLSFSTSELLKFNHFAIDEYEKIENNTEYIHDLQTFRAGVSVRSEGKSYDSILGHVRFFRACLIILLRRYYSLIREIQNHKFLDNAHKDILFNHLYESQIGEYTSGCWLIDFEDDLKKMKENLYTGFVPKMKDELKFFNSDFYELFELIKKNPVLEKLRTGSYKH